MDKVCIEDYQAAIKLIEEAESAKKLIEKYEEEQKYVDDPVLEIMEKGVMTVTEFEVIPNHLLGRVSACKYEFNGQTVERKITYLNSVEDKNFLAIKEDKVILI